MGDPSKNMRNLLFAALLLATACGGRPPTAPSNQNTATPPATPGPVEPPDGKVRVTGRVLGFGDGVGVANIAVSFGGTTALTDRSGGYTLDLLPGRYEPLLEGSVAGTSYVGASAYRGDFFVQADNCVSRYGIVVDAHTYTPIVGATVTLSGRSATSGNDGWYRIDLGCPANGGYGFNTTFIYASRSGYGNYSQVIGRGVWRVSRLDILLQPA